jgi:hypothetical protein
VRPVNASELPTHSNSSANSHRLLPLLLLLNFKRTQIYYCDPLHHFCELVAQLTPLWSWRIVNENHLVIVFVGAHINVFWVHPVYVLLMKLQLQVQVTTPTKLSL